MVKYFNSTQNRLRLSIALTFYTILAVVILNATNNWAIQVAFVVPTYTIMLILVVIIVKLIRTDLDYQTSRPNVDKLVENQVKSIKMDMKKQTMAYLKAEIVPMHIRELEQDRERLSRELREARQEIAKAREFFQIVEESHQRWNLIPSARKNLIMSVIRNQSKEQDK